MPSTHTPTADTTNNKMATYSTIPAAEEPLVAKPQGKSLKALVAGAAVASFALSWMCGFLRLPSAWRPAHCPSYSSLCFGIGA